MTEFERAMQNDPPRLLVLYKVDESGLEQLHWTMVGGMPTLSLIGAIITAQVKLVTRDPYLDRCPETMLVVTYNKDKKEFAYFVHPDIPVAPLAGYLEMVKAMVGAQRLGKAQTQVQQRGKIVGLDGKPFGG